MAALPHIRIEHLALERGGRTLFRRLDLTLERGSFVAVVGPSGIGKSSLLAVLSGQQHAEDGRISYSCLQQCTHEPSDYCHRIGIVFQNFRLAPNASLLENTLCGKLGAYPWWRTICGFPRADRERACALLAHLGLARLCHRCVAQVSGGEQQRCAIARALIQDPELLLLDEPVSQLDPGLAEQTLALIRNHARERAITAFCVLHQPDLVRRFADFVLEPEPAQSGSWRLVPASQWPETSPAS